MISELRVEYPSDPSLRAVGRVAVIGVLLRLRTPMMAVEQFRSELNEALAMDEQKTALACFAKYLKADERLHDSIPLLQARVVRVQRNMRDETIGSSEAEVQLNKVNTSIRMMLGEVNAGMLKDEV